MVKPTEDDPDHDSLWREWHMKYDAGRTNLRAMRLWGSILENRAEVMIEYMNDMEKWDPEARRVELFVSEVISELHKLDRIFATGFVMCGALGKVKAKELRDQLISSGGATSAPPDGLLKRKVYSNRGRNSADRANLASADKPKADKPLTKGAVSVPKSFAEGTQQTLPECE